MAEPIPVQNSPSLASIEDASLIVAVGAELVKMGRNPVLATSAANSQGDTPGEKARNFIRAFDENVQAEVDKRFSRGTVAAPVRNGPISTDDFLRLSREAQDPDLSQRERDTRIAEMVGALRQGRVK